MAFGNFGGGGLWSAAPRDEGGPKGGPKGGPRAAKNFGEWAIGTTHE